GGDGCRRGRRAIPHGWTQGGSAMTSRDGGLADPVAGQISRRSVALGIGFIVPAGAAAIVTPRRHERSIGDARLADIMPERVEPYQVAPGGSLILPEEQSTNAY